MRKAKCFERALVLEILYFAALRIQNLSTLHLDKNIQVINGKTVLRFEGIEMKNHQALECELPDFVAQNLQEFVESHRPKLNGAGGRHLFPGRNDGHKHHSTLRAEFKKMVHRHLGQQLHPHFMRHLSTHVILQDDPSNLPLASIRLGHRSMETLTRAYADNPTRAASRKANGLLKQKPKAGHQRSQVSPRE
ncbi:MAG: tyrosine-type recombinase/integrase [Rhizomicrobium sp.]